MTWLIIVVNVAIFVFSIAQPDRTMRRYDGDGTVQISGFDAITLGVRLHALRARLGVRPARLRRGAARRPSDDVATGQVRVHRATSG